MIKNRYLFDFSSSFIGGGFKRLLEYSKFFNINGGAYFFIHPNSEKIIESFPGNQYMIVKKNTLQKLLNNQYHLDNFFRKNCNFDLFYSYGIPIIKNYARVNWLHVSSILPFMQNRFPLTIPETIKIEFLRKAFKDNIKNADIVSAESNASLGYIKAKKIFLSENGSDDEISLFHDINKKASARKDTAIILGTYKYKALDDAYKIFQLLRLDNHNLKLVVIGDESSVPKKISNDKNVSLTGLLSRDKVIQHLISSKYYLSATLAENSYNAASEGIFLSETSYISDIPPHQELLKNCIFEEFVLPDSGRIFYKVKAINLTTNNIKTWNQVILEFISYFKENLKSN